MYKIKSVKVPALMAYKIPPLAEAILAMMADRDGESFFFRYVATERLFKLK